MKRENIKRISVLRKLLKGLHYAPVAIEEIVQSWLGYALGVSIDYKMTDTVDKDGFTAKKIEFLEISPSKKAKEKRFIIAQCAAERFRNYHKDFKVLVNDFSQNALLPESGVISYKVLNENVKHNKIYVSTKASDHCKEFVDFVQACLNGRNETAVLKYARFEY